ncbi:hypothetical protein GC101_27940 [Paenibacillus sp. LMG 31459]|uniref:Uncharacterized protein n=1 Tax=Paenibacillus phytohabitans TaxID=2654978 RepID=A0ABX1YP84_9BACL|nr:hypothetical protein [Paenibacillus phytohabitans]NOU82698.1 hypothetical protein [Paenibacillus phytohabitans]
MKRKIISSVFILSLLIGLFPLGSFAKGSSIIENDSKSAIAQISSKEIETFNSTEIPETLIDWLHEQGTEVTGESVVQFVPVTQTIETLRGDGKQQGKAILVWNNYGDEEISISTVLPLSANSQLMDLVDIGVETGTPGTVGYGLTSKSWFTAHYSPLSGVIESIRPLKLDVTAYGSSSYNINNFKATWVTQGDLLIYPGYSTAPEGGGFPMRHEIITNVSSPVMGTKYTGNNPLRIDRVFKAGGGLAWICGVAYDVNVNGTIHHFEVHNII